LVDHLPHEEAPLPGVSAKESMLRTWDEQAHLPDFRIPVGRTPRGRLVRASEASPGLPYTYPGCDSPLTLRKGEVRAAHFAHKSSGFCSPETALHRGVKAWIAGLFSKYLRHRKIRLSKVLAYARDASDSRRSGPYHFRSTVIRGISPPNSLLNGLVGNPQVWLRERVLGVSCWRGYPCRVRILRNVKGSCDPLLSP